MNHTIRCTLKPNQFSIVLTGTNFLMSYVAKSNSKLNVQKNKWGHMKNVCSVLAILTLAVACGPRKKVIVENPYDDSSINNRVSELEQRVAALELGHLSTVSSINASQSQLDGLLSGQNTLASDLSTLSQSVSDLQTLTADELDELNHKLNLIEASITYLSMSSTSSVDAANASIASLSSYIDYLISLGVVESTFLRSELTALKTSVSTLQTQNGNGGSNGNPFNNLQNQINSLQSSMATLQSQANAQQAQLTTLVLNENVVEFVDPCGNGPGFDEVLLRTSSGKYVAYFENGGNRFLTVLDRNVAYATTDQQACTFTIGSNGTLIY